MTNEEKDLLIDYLVDAGELDPEGDVEAQFLDWHRVRESVVPGEVHYKAILDAARVRKRSFEEGRPAGLAEVAAKLGWDELAAVPGFTASWTTSAGRRGHRPRGKTRVTGPDRARSAGGYAHDGLRGPISPKTSRLWPFWQQRTGLE